MKISELIFYLKHIQVIEGDLEIVIHNYKDLGDSDFMFEKESLVVRDNILYVE